MGEWLWTTYILYVVLIYTIVGLVKLAESRGVYGANRISKVYTKHNAFGIACYIMIWLILVMLAVTRNVELYPKYPSDTGTIDMQAYLYFFRIHFHPGWDWSKILTLRQTEPLFYTISNAVHFFTDNYRMMWFVVYGLVAFGFVLFISQNFNKNTNLYVLPVFFSAYLYSLSAIRTALSIAFAYIALTALKKHKFFSQWISTFFGFLSHYIIVVIFPVSFFNWIVNKIKNARRFWLCLGTMVFVGGSHLIMEITGRFIEGSKYKAYLSTGSSSIIGQAVVIVLGILVLFFYNELNVKYQNEMVYIHLAILNLLFVPFIINFNIYRVNYYFLPIRILAWGMVLRCIKDKFVCKNKGFQILIDCGAACLSFLWLTKCIYDMHGIGIMPYYTEWI